MIFNACKDLIVKITASSAVLLAHSKDYSLIDAHHNETIDVFIWHYDQVFLLATRSRNIMAPPMAHVHCMLNMRMPRISSSSALCTFHVGIPPSWCYATRSQVSLVLFRCAGTLGTNLLSNDLPCSVTARVIF